MLSTWCSHWICSKAQFQNDSGYADLNPLILNPSSCPELCESNPVVYANQRELSGDERDVTFKAQSKTTMQRKVVPKYLNLNSNSDCNKTIHRKWDYTFGLWLIISAAQSALVTIHCGHWKGQIPIQVAIQYPKGFFILVFCKISFLFNTLAIGYIFSNVFSCNFSVPNLILGAIFFSNGKDN